MDRLPIALQNAYADLLSRLEDARVAAEGREAGTFVRKIVKGRSYWYHQPAHRAKARKDIMQADILLDALATDRPADVRDMWAELAAEGRRNWQAMALDGLQGVNEDVRRRVRAVIGV